MRLLQFDDNELETIVAALDDVVNANKATFLIFLKKIIGFKLANIFSTNEYVKNK